MDAMRKRYSKHFINLLLSTFYLNLSYLYKPANRKTQLLNYREIILNYLLICCIGINQRIRTAVNIGIMQLGDKFLVVLNKVSKSLHKLCRVQWL